MTANADAPADPLTTSPVAVSTDGRTFTYRGGDDALLLGDLILLQTPDSASFLGQVLEQAPESTGTAVISAGSVIGLLDADGVPRRSGRRPFAAATVVPADAAVIEALQRDSGAGMTIGTWRNGALDVAARLRAAGFNRHTFLCGQSGSGKTYALGVILEQLLLDTNLRMVILDPNADFVRLGDTRPETTAADAQRLGEAEVRVLRSNAGGGQPLRMRFMTLPRQAQAAVLQLDPLVDRGEYNLFIHMMANLTAQSLGEMIERLRAGGADDRALAQRIENLGLTSWEVFAAENASASEVVATGARVTVMDLGGFEHPLEPHAVSLALVERLWANRESRTPTLIVIDEAHNLCPAQPSNSVQAAITERLIQIAAEGRKYGLWLLLSTQRPSKLHPQVISQCDNLALMRMNSTADLAELGEIFGFVPPQLLQMSRNFVQGEALVAGGFVPAPALVRMGARLTQEGGRDVSVPVV
ncbi:hypothetical protein SAMN05892883_1419 [Jatrophihabitans sp. GAS493]|uniref:ATP-binding protein n=1 Tax=Jatrophihabitans sp. GAS493 TaxID=1907575 RepID=UPI000BC047C9|nr:ATP-binding protein [Jatrophihabitans sp. GAS493]SOD71959.1 hypothetical protein SAMN05892883_1419 [Jatrophihabitans sp. GAS493]